MKAFFYTLLDKFIVPEDLMKNKSRKIIHLTDTPSQLYSELDRLLKCLAPDIVIHTGDISDEIKLERSPSKIDLHQKKLMKLNGILQNHPNTKFVFALGNHDDYKSMISLMPTAEIYLKSGVLETFWGTLGFAHKYDDLPELKDATLLYGHSDDRLHLHTNKPNYLNGLLHVYIFTEAPHKIWTVDYPSSIDSIRQKKLKIGF